MMDCHRVKNLLNAYIDRELDPRTETAVRTHLVDCDKCYHEYLSFVSVKAAVANVKEAQPSEAFCNRLKGLFEDDEALQEELKRVKCICRHRHAFDLSVFRRHSTAFIAVAAVALAAACAGAMSAGITAGRSAPGRAVYTMSCSPEAELPEIALRRAGLTAVKAENGETRYRMRERLLMQSGVSSDTYKLYCVAYRSR
ncbi:MAG: zf-HC2 domain-containing protein [Abditibacteriota bacterium]|nr:zf-HC2 domain-containing protein [Abditibacteriota bacterium]